MKKRIILSLASNRIIIFSIEFVIIHWNILISLWSSVWLWKLIWYNWGREKRMSCWSRCRSTWACYVHVWTKDLVSMEIWMDWWVLGWRMEPFLLCRWTKMLEVQCVWEMKCDDYTRQIWKHNFPWLFPGGRLCLCDRLWCFLYIIFHSLLCQSNV